MRRIVLAAAIAFASTAAHARDVAVTLNDHDQAQWAAVPTVLEQCIAGAATRGDVRMCRDVHAFVSVFLAKITAARQAPESKEPKPEEPPK